MGVVPHTCAPVFGRGGVSLSYSFSDAGAGDCVTFAPPPPLDLSPTAPPPVWVSPEQLALVAFDRARSIAASPSLEVAPAAIGLTGLPSYFWIAAEPRPILASAQAGALVVTAEAYPIQYEWDFGDGAHRTVSRPGRAWRPRRPGNLRHLYEGVGTYRVEVETIWEARWRIGIGGWTPLGYFSTRDARDYRVRQLIPFLVRSRR